MRVILVASDLSERSDRAVRRGVRLAAARGAACHILHVVDEDLPAQMAGQFRASATEVLAQTVASLDGGDRVTADAVIGDPVRAIAEEAEARAADLVVFGTHRPRIFLDMLRETTVERMVRLVAPPALVVRDPVNEDYARVLAPVSFSHACAKALRTAHDLVPDAEISAFHAVHLPFTGFTHEKPGGQMDREMTAEVEDVRREWCKAQALPDALCDVAPVTGSLGEILGERVQTFKPDLIALGAHTRGRLAARTLGSFAAEMVRHPPTDLLIADS